MTSGVPPRMKSAAAHSAQTPKDKTVSHRNIALPDFQRAMHGLGSSSATEKHKDRRTRRARTRSADRERSIRDYS